MVKVAILGAHNPIAGELIRILINHPEIELAALYSQDNPGRNVASIHHGLIGEPRFNFIDKLNIEEYDVVIVAENSEIAEKIVSQSHSNENLKSIVLNDFKHNENERDLFDIGLSEINRKKLVRTAHAASLLSTAIVPALITLVPLAQFMLLNSTISINVNLPKDIAEKLSIERERENINLILQKCQPSFRGDIILNIIPEERDRSQVTSISFHSNMPLEEIEKIYDQTYDDHNFTFISKTPVSRSEVKGTQRVVIYPHKTNNETLNIEVVSDARMRGGAGDAVHVLNLFFGLHEKTGLNLKPSAFKAD